MVGNQRGLGLRFSSMSSELDVCNDSTMEAWFGAPNLGRRWGEQHLRALRQATGTLHLEEMCFLDLTHLAQNKEVSKLS